MVHAARALRMGVMLGCMLESGLGIAAGCCVAPLCDHVDLDGNLLLRRRPLAGRRARRRRAGPVARAGSRRVRPCVRRSSPRSPGATAARVREVARRVLAAALARRPRRRSPAIAGAVAAAEETLEWVASPRRSRRDPQALEIDGRVRRLRLAGRSCAPGVPRRRLRAAIRGSTRSRSRSSRRSGPTAAGTATATATCTHSSFNETWGPILGLARYGADGRRRARRRVPPGAPRRLLASHRRAGAPGVR